MLAGVERVLAPISFLRKTEAVSKRNRSFCSIVQKGGNPDSFIIYTHSPVSEDLPLLDDFVLELNAN